MEAALAIHFEFGIQSTQKVRNTGNGQECAANFLAIHAGSLLQCVYLYQDWTRTMLNEEEIASFRENGYLKLDRPVLTPEQTAELRDALERTLQGKSAAAPEANRNLTGDDENIVIQVVNIWEAEPAFRRHLYNANIVPKIAQLMNTDTVRAWHDQIQVKPPHVGGPTTWHQDHPYWPVIQPADLISAWVALEDATIENGCMSMVPRSYKWGPYRDGSIGHNYADHSPTPDPAFIPSGESVQIMPIEVLAGHVVFHHCLTWHGAPPNRSPHNRPAIAVHYMPGYTRYEPTEKGHLVERHIHVAPGETLVGEHFPTVYENGIVLTPA